jgi:hypothetical protein
MLSEQYQGIAEKTLDSLRVFGVKGATASPAHNAAEAR